MADGEYGMTSNEGFKKDLKMIGFLLLSSTVCLVVAMHLRTITLSNAYNFLLWDMFLAWTPLLISTTMTMAIPRSRKYIMVRVGLILLWIVLLPNAAYLFTELIHAFRYVEPTGDERFWDKMHFWYHLAIAFGAAVTGLLISTLSILQMQRLMKQRAGSGVVFLLVFILLVLTSLGVYIGRFNRWNSWDLLTQPSAIVMDLIQDLLRTDGFAFSFVVMIFMVQAFAYGFVKALRGK